MLLPCPCHALAMFFTCYCHGIAMLLPWFCHVIAMFLPCYSHGIAMACSWLLVLCRCCSFFFRFHAIRLTSNNDCPRPARSRRPALPPAGNPLLCVKPALVNKSTCCTVLNSWRLTFHHLRFARRPGYRSTSTVHHLLSSEGVLRMGGLHHMHDDRS